MLVVTEFVKACLHIPTPFPSPSSFIIVPMVTGRLMGRMDVEPILPVRQPVYWHNDEPLTGTVTVSKCVNGPLEAALGVSFQWIALKAI